MKTIFRAVGPAFKQGLVVEPFESVNVYALLCELLGITPEPHDGSLEVTKPMLREPTDPTEPTGETKPTEPIKTTPLIKTTTSGGNGENWDSWGAAGMAAGTGRERQCAPGVHRE